MLWRPTGRTNWNIRSWLIGEGNKRQYTFVRPHLSVCPRHSPHTEVPPACGLWEMRNRSMDQLKRVDKTCLSIVVLTVKNTVNGLLQKPFFNSLPRISLVNKTFCETESCNRPSARWLFLECKLCNASVASQNECEPKLKRLSKCYSWGNVSTQGISKTWYSTRGLYCIQDCPPVKA